MKLYVQDSPKSIYYSLLHGIVEDNLQSIQLAIREGADLKKVLIREDFHSDHGAGLTFMMDENQAPVKINTRGKKLISVEKGCFQNCSGDIGRFVFEQLYPNSISIDLLIQNLKDKETYDSKITQQFVKQFGVEHSIVIDCYSNPFRIKNKGFTTFALHLAIYFKNLEAIKQLLKLGANPNKLDSKNNLPINNLTKLKEQSSFNEDVIKECIFYGLNINNSKVWLSFKNNLTLNTLKKIIKAHPTKSLFAEILTSSLSWSVRDTFNKTNPNIIQFYPILRDIEKFENQKIKICLNESDYDHIRSFEQFFKFNSLSDAAFARYKNKSPRLLRFINKTVLYTESNDNNTTRTIFCQRLKLLDMIKFYFDEDNKDSSSFLDFVDFMNNFPDTEKKAYSLDRFYESIHNKKLKKMTSHLFSNTQLKTIFENSILDLSKNKTCEVNDTIDMFFNHKAENLVLLKRLPFARKDSIKKIHDFLAEVMEKIDQPLFNLHQEKLHPKLSKLKDISVQGFTLKVAETNHDLIDWGVQLGHCVGNGNYSEKAKKGEIILIALYQKENPAYCIEIINGKINQLQGKSDSELTKSQRNQLDDVLKKIGLVK